MHEETGPIVVVEQVTKQYEDAAGPVLRGVSLTLEAGESVAVTGPSGCGKSTLLNLIGALDRPTSGALLFRGEAMLAWDEARTAEFRNRQVGFVFQFHHLLPQCTILENVLLPTLVHPDRAEARPRAERLIERVGLKDRMHARPGQLSGGERQRAAVVRALINRPSLLLADEPTGALNEAAADDLATLLLELNREEGMALLTVTHAPRVAERMGRVLELHEGRLVSRE